MDAMRTWCQTSFKKNRNLFEIRRERVSFNHSKKGMAEDALEIIVRGTLKLVNHNYTSNWAIYNTMYDVLVGMPWHVAHNPDINNGKKIVNFCDV